MGYTALYRQYRPRVFDQVRGQSHIITTLKNQISGNKIAHAYLFAGTRGTGKTTTARIFSRAVNCIKPENGNPCNQCIVCEKALAGNLMDIVEIDAASNRGVDEIRDLREKVKYPPTEGRFKVYIVDEVHMLTTEAFNALLKTLEEPPSHIIFILATTEPHRLPATVLSRCQRFDFKRISIAEIADLLRQVVKEADIDIDDKALEHIAGRVDGSARDALGLLDKCYAYGEERITLDKIISVLGIASEGLLFNLAETLSRRDAAGCITLLSDAIGDGKDAGRLFKDIIHYLRDMLVVKVSPLASVTISETKRDALLALVKKIEINTLIRWISILSEAEAKAKWSTYSGVLLEVALIKLCEPTMGTSLEGIIDRISRLEKIVLKDEAYVDTVAGRGKRDTDTMAARGLRRGESPGKGENEKNVPKGSEFNGDRDAGVADDKKSDSNAKDETTTEKKPSLEEIAKGWDGTLKRIEKTKKGLYTIIKGSRPIEVKGATLVIGCKALTGIYREIANRKENKDALKDALASTIGMHFNIQIENIADDKQERPAESEQGDQSLYAEAVEIFGEEIVGEL